MDWARCRGEARLQAAPTTVAVPPEPHEQLTAHLLSMGIPVEHLLVATDFSESSKRAVVRALERGNALGAQIGLLHVVEEGLPPELARLRRDEARDRLAELARSSSREPGCDVSFNVRVGEPCLEIIREAIELGSDAIILGLRDSGSHGTPASTALDVVRYGRRPVLLVAQAPSTPYGCAVVQVDPFADRAPAQRAARRLAPQAETHVVELVSMAESGFDELSAAPVAARGSAVAVLMDCVRRVGADLLVIGADGLRHDDHAVTDLLRYVSDTPRCDLLLAGSP